MIQPFSSYFSQAQTNYNVTTVYLAVASEALEFTHQIRGLYNNNNDRSVK
jgi:hypothetical protein